MSVCIPTYNRAGKLQRAVDGLRRSSYQNLEIIISDNASDDDTERVCNDLRATDSRVKYIRHPENMGPVRNFEFARTQASGKYFLWHADDDHLDPDYIRTCITELERDPSLVLASGLAAYHDRDDTLTHYGNVIRAESDVSLLRVLKYLWLVSDNAIFCGAYRTDSVRDCTVPNVLAGDWIWIARVLLRGKARMIADVHIHRDVHESMSSSMARIVSAIGAPSWHATYPLIAISTNVARNVVWDSSKSDPTSFLLRSGSSLLMGAVVASKGLSLKARMLASKVPFARQLYRTYFKRAVVG